jgi:ATP-dependent DNA ligase
VDLPVLPPLAPMLAKAAHELPVGDWLYEPKWDGFRCVVFRDGDEVELGSRNERPLTRYFPEVVDAVRSALPERVVVDGEIVVAGDGGLDFDLLSQRIHPADSRVRRLAGETPAAFVAFDLVCLGDTDHRATTFEERRALLVGAVDPTNPSVHLTPITDDVATAADWFERFEGAGLDGVVAKGRTSTYEPNKRSMVKVKHERTAEFVVAGFRWHRPGGTSDQEAVGSLMLGLYDGEHLQHVGVIGSFPAVQRRALVATLAPYRDPAEHPWATWAEHVEGATGSRPVGGGSRWNATKDLSFEPLRPALVVEAAYEHLQGHRLRHTARFRRWRPDRDPQSCTYDQVEVAVPSLLADVFAARG